MKVILDTGFLSSFLKINRLELILKFSEIDHITIPLDVLEELKKAPFFESVGQLFGYKEESHSLVRVVKTTGLRSITFGAGETARIQLAKQCDGILLIDDKNALIEARKNGIRTYNLMQFLLSCKKIKLLSTRELELILLELKEKDHYLFSKQDYTLLLEGTDE